MAEKSERVCLQVRLQVRVSVKHTQMAAYKAREPFPELAVPPACVSKFLCVFSPMY